jgi:hypothetical protein
MRHGTVRPAEYGSALIILCVVVILGSLALRSVAGPLCLSARSLSGCQRCCQPKSPSEAEARVPPCSLFCCTGLPGAPNVPNPPVLSLAVALPGLHDLSVCLALTPPPPKFSLSIQGRRS